MVEATALIEFYGQVTLSDIRFSCFHSKLKHQTIGLEPYARVT